MLICSCMVQMRDTVELNPAGVFLLEKLFSKSERAKLFRTWAGSASMLLKGGNAIWGKFTMASPSQKPFADFTASQAMRTVPRTIQTIQHCHKSICVSLLHARPAKEGAENGLLQSSSMMRIQ